ncbi:MAG TPA: hypothetical protein PLN86_11540 [Candidatus Hydrogenedentes bacterium]|nr:hypothetical protein [Candidatus Hydrogenedentota bacterium]
MSPHLAGNKIRAPTLKGQDVLELYALCRLPARGEVKEALEEPDDPIENEPDPRAEVEIYWGFRLGIDFFHSDDSWFAARRAVFEIFYIICGKHTPLFGFLQSFSPVSIYRRGRRKNKLQGATWQSPSGFGENSDLCPLALRG